VPVGVVGKNTIELVRSDRELGEDLVQVILHGPGADEQDLPGR
jgi:hypothetical protein